MKEIYKKNEFCVPVTKSSPMEEIEFIIKDFVQKKISFCVGKVKTGFEIWRKAESTDIDSIKKKGAPTKPQSLYIKGLLITDFDIED